MGGSFPNTTSNSSSPAPQRQPQPRNASLPPAISIDRQDGLALLSLLQAAAAAGAADKVLLQLQLLEVPALDASALLLWIMAVGTVVAGSLYSGADYALELKGAAAGFEGGRSSGSGHGRAQQDSGGGLEILEVTAAGAVGFVLFSSGMLVLLYFFLNKAFFYVILVGFSLAGAQALGIMLLPAARAVLPSLACRKVTLPFGWGHVTGTEVAVTPVALAVAVVWAVARNASWSWVFQDLLGVAVMLLVLRTLRLPDLRVACILLPLCFCYDVFWVFLQPMLTGGGTSVMVEVAGGGDSHEFLPMLLRVPRISGPPILKGAYSLLGFGDVILPGMLVALTRR
jgi:signal peptide peptidase-like protein 2B